MTIDTTASAIPTRTMLMSLDKWLSIPDNPIQRDTERHAHYAAVRHLKENSVTHRHVSMATVGGAGAFKLDGHTRAYLIEKGKLEPDYDTVSVVVYECQNMQQVEELYKQFDNQMASEKARDRLFGAYRSCNFKPNSTLLINGPVPSMLQCLGRPFYNSKSQKYTDPYIAIPTLKEPLTLLDGLHLSTQRGFTTGILSACVATLCKDGEQALDFWYRFAMDEGIKYKDKRDAVQMLKDTVRVNGMSYGGGSEVLKLCQQAISCYQVKDKGVELTKRPIETKLGEYFRLPDYVKSKLEA